MRERALRDATGSVLALMPAAVLVFVVLGSLTVDASLAFLGEREVANLASAVANDAATQGIDLDRYYATGEVVIDPARVRAVADAATSGAGLDHLEGLVIETDVAGEVVRVRVRARVRSLFSRVLPGGLDVRDVAATAQATAERG